MDFYVTFMLLFVHLLLVADGSHNHLSAAFIMGKNEFVIVKINCVMQNGLPDWGQYSPGPYDGVMSCPMVKS